MMNCDGGCSFWDCQRTKGHAGPCQPAKRRKSATGTISKVHTQGLDPAMRIIGGSAAGLSACGAAVEATVPGGGLWAIIHDADADGFFAITLNAAAVQGPDIDWSDDAIRDALVDQLHNENRTRPHVEVIGRSTFPEGGAL